MTKDRPGTDSVGVKVSGLAGLVSRWVDPRYLVGPVILVASLRGAASLVEAAGWALLTLAMAVLPLLAFIALRTKQGAFADWQVPHRHRRNQVYLMGSACLLAC